MALVAGLIDPGLGSTDDAERPGVPDAITRILRSVEWERYGGPGTAAWMSDAGVPSRDLDQPGQAAGVLVVDRVDPKAGQPRPGALAGDVRIVRHALGQRAGWVRRARAVAVPRSVLVAPARRGPHGPYGVAG